MGDLQDIRTEILPLIPIEYMELFGPWEIKDDIAKKSPKKIKKVYRVLFTCATTHAVYLEVTQDCLMDSILLTIRNSKKCQEYPSNGEACIKLLGILQKF